MKSAICADERDLVGAEVALSVVEFKPDARQLVRAGRSTVCVRRQGPHEDAVPVHESECRHPDNRAWTCHRNSFVFT